MEGKQKVVNCDICDARMVDEETMASFEQAVINADIILTNAKSRKALESVHSVLNADRILDWEGECDMIVQNGNCEIYPEQKSEKKSVLVANGSLHIYPGTEAVLEQYVAMVVNGRLCCPRSLMHKVNNLTTNGKVVYYPDECTLLPDAAVPDRYFALRAKQDGHYFAADYVALTDPMLDAGKLSEKNVHFTTPLAYLPEERAEAFLPLFDEKTELRIVPEGYAFVEKNAYLDETLLRRFGTKLYIRNKLKLDTQSTPYISRLEAPQMQEVQLTKSQKVMLDATGAVYEKVKFVCGVVHDNKVSVTVDRPMLEAAEDGVSCVNCVKVKLVPDLTPELIAERLELINCVTVVCTPEQEKAVGKIGKNIVKIKTGEEKSREEELKEIPQVRVINCDTMVL